MCATNLWALNSGAFTDEFRRFTAGRIGVEPTQTDLRIVSSRVRSSSAVFTLTHRMCDCSTLIGRRRDPAADGEVTAEAWLGWLRGLPAHVPHVSRIAVLRAWSPDADIVAPRRARGIRIGEVSEEVLRDIRDDELLTIDYPRTV